MFVTREMEGERNAAARSRQLGITTLPLRIGSCSLVEFRPGRAGKQNEILRVRQYLILHSHIYMYYSRPVIVVIVRKSKSGF